MSESNKSYWEKRQEQKYLSGEKKVNEYYTGLKKSFEQAKREIQSVITNFYWRYAEENGLTYASAQLKLSKSEIGELQDYIDKVYENMGKYDQDLNNMSIRSRITRYEALEKQIDATLQQLYAIEYQHKGEELLKEVYSDSYYQTWFNIDQYNGFHQEFAQISAQTVEELITYPFNGADFSSRLWKQKDYMLQSLNESITTMLIQGRNPTTLTKEFAKKFETKEYEAYRLLHTEGSFIMEQASQKVYAEDGVEKYQWLATLDSKTCEECQPLDGKVFDVGQGVTGVNLTPKHCFCRCTTVPYYDDQDLSEDTRVARDIESGKSYDVPADMNYEQWHKEYIENNPEALFTEKKLKNLYDDKKQYDEYKKVLGSNVPKSLDDFQNLKYNDAEKWNDTQGYYKYIGKYPDSNKQFYNVWTELKRHGIDQGVVLPAKNKQAFILPEGKKDAYHIMKRMYERNITDDDVKSYTNKAKCMFVQWGGTRQLFYSDNGATVITKSGDDWIYKTAWSKADYDSDADKILEVINKHVK